MTTLDVACHRVGDDWSCAVRAADDGSALEYQVRVRDRDLADLAPGATDPEELVRRSFEFLLEREPKESILRSFDLPVIERYFPDYREVIGRP